MRFQGITVKSDKTPTEVKGGIQIGVLLSLGSIRGILLINGKIRGLMEGVLIRSGTDLGTVGDILARTPTTLKDLLDNHNRVLLGIQSRHNKLMRIRSAYKVYFEICELHDCQNISLKGIVITEAAKSFSSICSLYCTFGMDICVFWIESTASVAVCGFPLANHSSKKMELLSYTTNPRSSLDAYILHSIRVNLTDSALQLDDRAVSFRIGIANRKGWLGGTEQPDSYPLQVDLLDGEYLSLLDYYHDYEPDKYEYLTLRLKALVENYLDEKDYALSILSARVDSRTDTCTIPHHWLQKIIPRLHNMTVTIGGVSTIASDPLSEENLAYSNTSRYSQLTLAVVPRRSRSNARIWELTCDVGKTVREVHYETDLHPELAHYNSAIREIRNKLLQTLEEMYRQGCVVCPGGPPKGWNFVESSYKDVYLLGWKNSKITNGFGSPTQFAEALCRNLKRGPFSSTASPIGIIIPYRCPDNDHSRHFVARMMLQLGYPVPVFQKEKMLQFTESYAEAALIASLVQLFSLAFTGLHRTAVNSIHRVNPSSPVIFDKANDSDKSAYLSLDSDQIYTYSILEHTGESSNL